MKSCETFLLLLTAAATGSGLVINMNVSKQVYAARGDDALLFCSFTHSDQSSCSGPIDVSWIAREPSGDPFFKCSIINSSDANISQCSHPKDKYALAGDPRQGALSLLIRNVTLMDGKKYFCKVGLLGGGDFGEVNLRLGERPRILSLTEQNTTTKGSLECVAEGSPPPQVYWFSETKHEFLNQIQTRQSGTYQVISYVMFADGDRITCQATNRLGRAELTYPEVQKSSLVLMVRVGVFVGVLLLTMGLLICKLRHFRCTDAGDPRHSRCPTEEGSQADPLDFSAHYQNRADVHQVLQSPAGGAVEPGLDFCTVDVHSLSQPAEAARRQKTPRVTERRDFMMEPL